MNPHTLFLSYCVLLEEDNVINLNKNKFIFIQGKEKDIDYATSHCKRIS